MTCARTWHLWRCDGCGVEMNWEHGQWAEPELPPGWVATLGWGLHACSAACKERVQAKHQDAAGRLFIWFDEDVRNPPPPHRDLRPAPAATPAQGAAPAGTAVFG